MTATADVRERSFEESIEAHLLQHGGYGRLAPDEFDPALCLFPTAALAFIEHTQPEAWQALAAIHKDDLDRTVVAALAKALDSAGTLDVLRHGFKVSGKTLHMAYWQPETAKNPDAAARYAQNQLCVTRQLRYAPQHANSLDLVLSLNGLPVATAELKNPLTGQGVHHAVKQYKEQRDPRDRMFAFKQRALVHFAVDPDQVYMTTRLKGKDTFFLPFNRGRAGGAGNPDGEEGYRTSYLWAEVWQRDSFLDILRRFVHVQVDERTVGDRVVRSEAVIFPRYHQLDCVRALIHAARAEGAGHHYLIQHSAGSGKSNSIAWLAHRLASLHDAEERRVFDSVVVITDRRVLDRQLQNTIYQFEHQQGVVEKIEKDSAQLAEALQAGKNIIITTLQKFPYVAEKLSALPDRRYAVIVDEAHSSQSGEGAKQMKEVLAVNTLEEAAADEEAEQPSWEDAVASSASARGRQRNLSFFAFTATPKAKTLEVFGRKGPDGKPRPFHLYTMRQAIEEGFILDVLAHYTTYKRYYKLIQAGTEDMEVEKRKAARALARFVDLHPHNLAQKTEIMVEHFRTHTRHRIGGQAKAMVVTASRLHAVRYKHAFDKYIRERSYKDIRTLVAFSGTVRDPDTGDEYTEPGMNGLREAEIPAKFASAEYHVLLVAEKYQTGFDQPLLHTMYVDKRLKGVHAVQTLSRLNRVHQGKDDTFVLDFVNDPEDIRKAFQPYYESTDIDESPDPQHLYQLQRELDDAQVYWASEVDSFCRVFFAPTQRPGSDDHARLYQFLNPALDRFNALPKEKQEEFRNRLKSFVNLYAFLSQVIPFTDTDLEKRYAFGRLLWKVLPKGERGEVYRLDDEVALKYYRLQRRTEGAIALAKGEGGVVRGLKDVGTASGDDPRAKLSELIEIINERFGTEFSTADMLLMEQIREDALAKAELREKALANTEDNFQLAFGREFDDMLIDRLDTNEANVTKILNQPALKAFLLQMLSREVYRRAREEASAQDG